MPPVFSRLRQVETRGYRCPHKSCRRTLTVMTCRKGPRSGLDYVNCFNRVHPSFWHFFALGEAHNNMNNIPPSPPHSAFCASPSCIKTRINRFCSRHMCKTHCLLDGGCPCHRESLPPSPPPVDPTYAWTLGSSLRNDIFPAPLHLESVARARREAELSALATLTPLPPSPTASEDAVYNALVSLPSSSSSSGFSFLSSSTLASSSTPASSSASSSAPSSRPITIFFWPTNGPVSIESTQDSQICRKSHLRLLDIAHMLVTDVFTDLDAFYQCYSTQYHSWMKISTAYSIAIPADGHLFVRRLGVMLPHSLQPTRPRSTIRCLKDISRCIPSITQQRRNRQIDFITL
ncbi:hypothetical protein R3P38DRAFT_3516262 [Favolaschia claudopus]|uniref:CxC6 like cysteine cluster associated with KDZ domain-containing protein n=1 Tax=Favolaschia claudopus TaxID=2862362 RepID=A0AAW0BR83_9AGAR